MTEPLFLSRARLKTARGEQLSAIAPSLLRGWKGETVGHAHRILWMLFRNRDDYKPRDFLWREEKPGHYLILSKQRPDDEHQLFDIVTKDYDPQLKPGDRLSFTLRANPVVTRKTEGATKGSRGQRCDIVMNALYPLAKRKKDDPRGESERAKKRENVTQQAARDWLSAQGARYGFQLVPNPEKAGEPYLEALNYETIEIPRLKEGQLEPRTRSARFGVLDLSGLIEITDPPQFLLQVSQGFGKAKAFGCGLMLIRRAV